MTTKMQRRGAIARVLSEQEVTSQGQLCDILASRGISTTQATISRDLEDLDAMRVGGVYLLPGQDPPAPTPEEALRHALLDHVVETARSGDLVVVRTPPGHAQLVGSALDRARIADVLGTVAGDDTVLVVAGEGRGAAVAALLNGGADPSVFRTRSHP